MNLNKITFDDVLKMGSEKGMELLRSHIGKELNNHGRRLRQLASIKTWDQKRCRVEDLINLLEVEGNGRKAK
jgi:hypothetical protein